MELKEEEIIQNFKEYLEDKNATYAIMLNGKWGSGKTHFVKNKLDEERLPISEKYLLNTHQGYRNHLLARLPILKLYYKQEKEVPLPIYISLYGISSIEEVKNMILLEIAKTKYGEYLPLAEKVVPIATIAINTLVDSLTIRTISLRNAKKARYKIFDIISPERSKYYFIFDDLERCKLPIEEIFGYINIIIEHNKAKVLIVANENEIVSDSYKTTKEKVIGYTFKYKPSLPEILETLTEVYNFKELKKEICDEFLDVLNSKKDKNGENHNNIRTIKQALSLAEKVEPILIDKAKDKQKDNAIENSAINQLKNEVFRDIIYDYIDYKNGTEIKPSFNFISKYISSRTFDKELVNKELKEKYNEIYIELKKRSEPASQSIDNLINQLNQSYYICRLEDNQLKTLVENLINMLQKIYTFHI